MPNVDVILISSRFVTAFRAAVSKLGFLLRDLRFSLRRIFFPSQYSLKFFLSVYHTVLYQNPHLEGVEDDGKRLSIATRDLFQVRFGLRLRLFDTCRLLPCAFLDAGRLQSRFAVAAARRQGDVCDIAVPHLSERLQRRRHDADGVRSLLAGSTTGFDQVSDLIGFKLLCVCEYESTVDFLK